MQKNAICSVAALGLVIAWCAIPAVANEPMGDPAPPRSKTLSAEIAEMDVVIFVKLIDVPAILPSKKKPAQAQFEVIDILKGETYKVGQKIQLPYLDGGSIGNWYWASGKQMQWSVSNFITPRVVDYM